MTTDLDVLDPAPAVVDCGGERLEIRPLTIGQIPKVVRLARPILDGVLDAKLDAEADIVGFLVRMVGEHGDAAIAAASVITGKPVAWVEALNAAEFTRLVRAVVEVNRDFFVHALVPLLSGWTGRDSRSTAGAGPTPSNPSSSEGTG